MRRIAECSLPKKGRAQQMHLRVISEGVAEWDLCHNVNVQDALIALRINYYPIYRPSWIARQCVNACKRV